MPVSSRSNEPVRPTEALLATTCKETLMATGSGDEPARAKHENDGRVIVAIGASAGGIQALQNFFAEIPPNTGAAFIVVVHLDPEHRSELSAVVAARTNMRVL